MLMDTATFTQRQVECHALVRPSNACKSDC